MLFSLNEVEKVEKILTMSKKLREAGEESEIFQRFSEEVELPPPVVAGIMEAGDACLAMQPSLVRKALSLRYNGSKSVEVLSGLHGVSRMSFYRWRKDFLIDILIYISGIKKD